MFADDVPAALRDRLGADATAHLVELLDRAIDERKPEMISSATERFERRLVEETSAVRVLVAQTEARLREQLAHTEARLREQLSKIELRVRDQLAQTEARVRDQFAHIRQDVAALDVKLRTGIGETESRLRNDMLAGESRIREDIAASRVELFKWSFVFWIGQTVALAGLMTVLIRLATP